MPHNLLKIFNHLLEIGHLTEHQRIESLRRVFERDFDDTLNFRTKLIRPIKKDGQHTVDAAFRHLITRDDYDEKGKKLGRSFEMARSVRLHWIKHHLLESTPAAIEIFSFQDRVDGRDRVRTYIYDHENRYVIILEPQKSRLDYYIITAYHLNEPGGEKQIKNKLKNRLPEIH
jgi:cytochrome oxidase Cu insertion factor (SCO1/SenC/PrrC family)